MEKSAPEERGADKRCVAMGSFLHGSWIAHFKPDVISTAIISISTIGWVGGYAVTDLDEAGNR